MTNSLLDVRTIDRDGDVDVVALYGELDRTNVESLETTLRENCDEPRATVVDLTGVTFVDSAGFAVFHRILQTGRVAVVVGPRSVVHRATEIVGIPSYEDTATAKRVVSSRGE
jgi:anti-anti-sigma factor